MKVVHRARLLMAKVVDVPDDLWKRYNEPATDEEADKASEELQDLMTKEGISYAGEEIEEVDDEWYDPITPTVALPHETFGELDARIAREMKEAEEDGE